MTCTVLVGGGWGDEGKGKCITYLCYNDKPSIIARAGVGPNAGHSVEFRGDKYGLRLTPSGFFHRDARLLIGAGVLVDPEVFLHEMEYLSKYSVAERTGVDYRCAIIEKKHKEQDQSSSYLSKKIGSTGTGCGPANAERVMRTAKLAGEVEELKISLQMYPWRSMRHLITVRTSLLRDHRASDSPSITVPTPTSPARIPLQAQQLQTWALAPQGSMRSSRCSSHT